jgi:acetyl/propionyl-CoA carboxylase alpha subunit
MIKKLLIANRGEIACRIIRSARIMGISTVAVYSDSDRQSVHTQLADEAIYIGASEPNESYLQMDKILAACRESGADAVHPGYGFLSERAEFSDACWMAGITFVGPPASAMRKLGNKIEAKQLALEVAVPITPGYFEPGATAELLFSEARKIGFPVMLKASAGGGGRGMRIVREPDHFLGEFAIASDEALSGFGDGSMMVEKLIERPRHIEVQFFADSQGSVAALYERECSLQRRHQKLVEEAPSPIMTETLWNELRESTIRLARAAGYVGAGTCEFMFDEGSEEFYFLEVNARLQVEHPVTELITGLDLVQLQIHIANGEELKLSSDVQTGLRAGIRGYAIEARIVAEDPSKNFLPSIGKIVGWAEPQDPFIRVDTGYRLGSEVSRYYDSLLAKVIAYAPERDTAIDRLISALNDFHILGVNTNISYLIEVLESTGFRNGDFDTGFLGREFADWQPKDTLPDELFEIVSSAHGSTVTNGECLKSDKAAWATLSDFRNAQIAK